MKIDKKFVLREIAGEYIINQQGRQLSTLRD